MTINNVASVSLKTRSWIYKTRNMTKKK